MSEQIEDFEQRLQAVDPERSAIVQAPAGSGKTELLIRRYLALLSRVNEPEEIVAITFTRKAAAEMQGRILAALSLGQSGKRPGGGYEQSTYDLAYAALNRSQDRGWDIAENPGRLRIQTVDSLCARLVRQMPLLSGLGGQPAIADDPVPFYEQAAAAALQELESGEVWSDAIARLLVHLDNDLPRIRDLLAIMLGKRDQWLGHVLHTHERRHLENALADLACEKLAQVVQIFPADLSEELCKLVRYAAGQLAVCGIPGNHIHCRELQSLPGSAAEDVRQWCGIADLLLTKSGTWRIRLDKNSGFPSPADNRAESELRTQMKSDMQGLIHRLREIHGLAVALDDVRRLPPLHYTDAEWDVVNALCQLLRLSAAQLQLLFAEADQMDFTGIAQAAIAALGDDDAPTDLAMHLDYQINHLLVDEFQDISARQFSLLQRLTAQWTGDDSRTLFLVGDPMQSIYRFREAEVGNFVRVFEQQRLGQVTLQSLVLTVNFRSERGIIEWVNHGFARMFPDKNDMHTGQIHFHPATANNNHRTEKNINIHPFFNDPGEQEAARVVDLIRALRAEESGGSLAVLVRNRNHLIRITPALRRAGIRFRAIEIESLAERPAIQDLLALTRAWTHLADRAAWLSVLRAPWCGLELQALLTLVNHEKDRTVWECCHDETILARLDVKARARLQRVTGIFADMYRQRHRQPVKQAVQTLWCRLGGPATLADRTDLENAAAFLELLETLDRGGEIRDMQLLLSSIDQLYAAPDNDAGMSDLQIMTIHKAKGLEFDHVLIPGLGRFSRGRQSELLKWMLRPRVDEGHDLLLAPIREAGGSDAPLYRYIQDIENEKDHHEEARLLYVAITRAKKSLHLLGNVQARPDKEGRPVCKIDARALLSHLWPVVSDVYEEALQSLELSVPEQPERSQASLLQRLQSGWSLPSPPQVVTRELLHQTDEVAVDASEVEYEWAGETIRRIGSVVHQGIHRIAEEGVDTWSVSKLRSTRKFYRLLLAQLGVQAAELPAACDEVEDALIRVLEDDRGRWILSSGHGDAHNEYALSGLFENSLVNVVIDRTFIDQSGVRWIIDYKISRHAGTDLESFLNRERLRYAAQLEKYGHFLRMKEDRPVRLGLYFPLLRGWREWEYEK